MQTAAACSYISNCFISTTISESYKDITSQLGQAVSLLKFHYPVPCVDFMTYNYSNFTQFGIENNVEKYAYVGWRMFVVICSLLGDTTILVASIKYKAFRLNRIVVVLIEHVAATDLLQVVCNLSPSMISAIFNRQGSSKILCYVEFFITYYLNTASAAFIAAMTLGKLLLLKHPLRAATWSKEKVHKVCVGIWLVSIYVPLMHLLVDKDDVTFDCRLYSCAYLYTKSVWKKLMPVLALLALFAPNVTIITSTVLILKEARKFVRRTHEKLRWQGITTVVLTATVYTLSILPITVYFIAKPLIEKNQSVPGPFFKEFFRLGHGIMGCNFLANFFVYSLTVDSFRSFLKTKFANTTSFLLYTVSLPGTT